LTCMNTGHFYFALTLLLEEIAFFRLI
jgi:hypothetical protein